MKIRLLKNHNGAQAGSQHDVAEDAANYLVRVGVAELVVETKKKASKETKELKDDLEIK